LSTAPSGTAVLITLVNQPGNPDYWLPKLKRNSERDRAVDAALCTEGWTLIRLWEYVDSETAAHIVATAISMSRAHLVRGGITVAQPSATAPPLPRIGIGLRSVHA
jgi:G:T-mismatch repair DNA endonuclease (very short patch repair protein)